MAKAPAITLMKNAGAVRLTMPARVANNLDGLKKGLASIADRLGHPACATGCDFLHLGQEREFVVSERMELNAQPLAAGIEATAAYASERGLSDRSVVVTIPDSVNNNLERLTAAVATVLGKLGCAACCSGFDILFRREFDHFSIDEKMNLQAHGRYR